MTKNEDIIAQYEALVSRALAIMPGAPYHRFVDEKGKDFAMLESDGEDATLFWPECVSNWDDGYEIESQSQTFPSRLLSLSDEALAEWKEEAAAAKEKAMAAERLESARRYAEHQRGQELALLAILKAKYER